MAELTRNNSEISFLLKAIALLVLSLSLSMCSSQKKAIDSVNYSDTTITIPAVIDTFSSQSLHDTIFITRDSVRIEIKTDTLKQFKLIYQKPEVKIVIDSVIRWKTIKEVQVVRITKHKCESKFHSFCTGFFWFALFLLVLRIIITSIL